MGYIDSRKKGYINKYPIISPDDVEKNSIIVIAPQFQERVIDIYNEIKKRNITNNIYWYHLANDCCYEGLDFLNDCCTKIDKWGDCIMPHIEFHIVDNCNLNCAGCSHFSPLFNGTKESFNEKIINVEKLLKKFSCIARLDILGGEPLLCKELDSYIIRLRELLPYTYMRIFTNGLLIPRISSNTFKIMRDNKIEFFVSEYAPTHKMITSIEETLKRERMRYTTSGFNKRSVFNICISINSNSVYPWCCISKGCYALGDGKIAKCPTLLYLHKFNEVFKQNLPTEGIIDIDNNMDGKRIIQLLESKVPLCDFCISKPIEWKSCKRPLIIEDFAAKE